MTDKEIVELYLSIPYVDRVRLKKEVKKERSDDKVSVIIRHINIMQTMTGLDVLSRRRDMEYIDARAVVAYVMNKKGYSEAVIGKALERDHSMVHKYIDDTAFYVSNGFNNSRTRLLSRYMNLLETSNAQ